MNPGFGINEWRKGERTLRSLVLRQGIKRGGKRRISANANWRKMIISMYGRKRKDEEALQDMMVCQCASKRIDVR